MSATVEAERTARIVGGTAPAPVVVIAGSLHKVADHWYPLPSGVRRSGDRGLTRAFLDHVASTTRLALAESEATA